MLPSLICIASCEVAYPFRPITWTSDLVPLICSPSRHTGPAELIHQELEVRFSISQQTHVTSEPQIRDHRTTDHNTNGVVVQCELYNRLSAYL